VAVAHALVRAASPLMGTHGARFGVAKR
jgi:hypothetical protein